MITDQSFVVARCCRVALVLFCLGDTNHGLTSVLARTRMSQDGSICISSLDRIRECRGPTASVISRNDKAVYISMLQSNKEAVDYNESPHEYHARKQQRLTQQSNIPLADPIGCRVYVAPSSIPNAGLGLYSGIEVPQFSPLGNPQIAIGIFDTDDMHFSTTRLSSYTWAAWTIRMQFETKPTEGKTTQALIPGVGMLSNCHLGLINVQHFNNVLPVQRRENFHRNKDPGLGAVSDYNNVAFQASQYIPRGAEVFVHYGEQWFLDRETSIGVVPFHENYVEADNIIQDFLEIGGDLVSRHNEWQSILDKYYEHHERTYLALPKDVSVLAKAAETGTARFATLDSIRSIEWLEQNGHCMDNLRVGYSPIPQAGRGAFATRHLPKGHLIASSPLVLVDRQTLYASVPEAVEHAQLLQNYCLGHGNSSILFFPYSGSVQYINHDTRSNARLQWSGQVEWLNESLTKLKNHKHPGLMIDIVATQDISVGDEVLIDYEPDWETAWREHLEQWSHPADHPIYFSAVALNEDVVSPIRTMSEMIKHSGIQTICLYDSSSSTNRFEFKSGFQRQLWQPCDILNRTRVSEAYFYTAHIHDYENSPQDAVGSDTITMTGIPRWAIAFTEEVYWSDQHIRSSFRKEIGFFPENLYPSAWLDLS